jgi:hypothetical protein
VSPSNPWTLSLRSSKEASNPLHAPASYHVETKDESPEWVKAASAWHEVDVTTGEISKPAGYILRPIDSPVRLYEASGVNLRALEHQNMLFHTWPNHIYSMANAPNRVYLVQPDHTTSLCGDYLSYAFHRRLNTFMKPFEPAQVVINQRASQGAKPVACSGIPDDRFKENLNALARDIFRGHSYIATRPGATLDIRLTPSHKERWESDLAGLAAKDKFSELVVLSVDLVLQLTLIVV